MINDDRVRSSIEAAARLEMEESTENVTFGSLIAKHTKRAHHLLSNMKTAISTTLIK